MRLISTVLHIVIILSMEAPVGFLRRSVQQWENGERFLWQETVIKRYIMPSFLSELTAEYLYPAVTECGIQGQITPRQVEDALKKDPEISAVVITSRRMRELSLILKESPKSRMCTGFR